MEAACWNKSDYSNYGRNSVADMIKANAYVKERNVIGPNCPGVITPGEAKLVSCQVCI
jgi:succinyl-CoA synthetase alpha subunit